MRLLIAFLLLQCFCLAGLAKTDRGTAILSASITATPTGPSLKAALPHQKAKSIFKRETLSGEVDLVNQHSTSFVLGAIQAIRNYYSYSFFSSSTLRIFRDKGNYSYHFIWSCLYPKHTFW